MKFTLSWLKEHLETDATLEAISDTLTMIGLEVEEITDPAKELAPFFVAEVLTAEQHPNADRLRVCMVNTGTETVQVVCGAPNARAGMKGVFAPSGTTIPSNGMKLKPTEIRGVKSNGMLCSEREMGMSDEHEGIIELPADAVVGTPFADVLGLNDPVIEIAITPNRPDCLGVHGIARDLAAAGLGTLKDNPAPKVEGKFNSPLSIELKFDENAKSTCPAFAGCYVRGIKNAQSPAWLQQKLKAIGLRPINALVDITNLITYDHGRPLHVYDADKVKGPIRARLGKSGEGFAALDGKSYDVDDSMCVIADDKGVLGLGGIIGGESSGSTEDTVNVFIECALFDPIRTAATGRKLGIESDARYRFERGVDPQSVLTGIEYAAQLVQDLCGGEPSEIVLTGEIPDTATKFDFDMTQVKRLGGLDVGLEQGRDILEKLGFVCEQNGALLKVTAPTWRPDIDESADLVEEIVRIIGVDQVPSTPMPRSHGVAKPILTSLQNRVARAKRTLAMRGLVEAVTWSFIERSTAQAFGGGSDELELSNPISSQMSSMRPSLLPGLIMAAGRNLDRGLGDVALFEVGQAYRGRAPEDQFVSAAGVRAGRARFAGTGRHWANNDPADIYEAKADALSVLEELGANAARAQITQDAPSWFHPGRSGVIRLGPKNELAHFGEVHPGILDELDVTGPIYAFEVFINAIPSPKSKAAKSKPPLAALDLQPVRRDFAFVVESSINAGDVIRAAQSADKILITAVRLFDVFEGGSLGEGKKSLGVEVTLQPVEKTLTDQEIEAVADKVVGQVQKATNAILRS